jgi:arylsulfatase A
VTPARNPGPRSVFARAMNRTLPTRPRAPRLLLLVLALLPAAPALAAATVPQAGREDGRRLEWTDRKEEHAVVTRCLTWLTGSSEENAHVSVGRLANHFGFVHFRISSGHTVERAALGGEVVDLLDLPQVERLLGLEREQRPLLAEVRGARLALNERLEESLDRDEPAPAQELVPLGECYGRLEARLGGLLARGFSEVHATLDAEQREALAALRARWEAGGGRRSGDRRAGAAAREHLKGADQETVQEFWNLATRLLTWITGSPEQNDFDTAGKPSQHFGFVSLRVESGHAITRGGIADALEEVLDETQLARLAAVVPANRADFEAFFAARAATNRELERGLEGLPIRDEVLDREGALQGAAEARMTARQAAAFLEVRRDLDDEQALALLELRERYLDLPGAEEVARDPLAAGRRLFRLCALCHVPQQEGRAIGPSLTGVLGRPVAGLAGHPYSEALRAEGARGATWTRERLDRFLADPRAAVPGTAMGFRGLPDPALRAALLDFLAAEGQAAGSAPAEPEAELPAERPRRRERRKDGPTTEEAPTARQASPEARRPRRGRSDAQRPNLLLLVSDDQAWGGLSVRMDPDDPGSAWSAVHTPALQRLADEGVRLARAYAPSPVCSPTRASLQTGKSPARLGWSKAAPVVSGEAYALLPPPSERTLSTDEVTIAERLAALGYRTAHFGKWHLLGGGPEAHGYEVSDGDTGNQDAEPFVDPNPVDIFGMVERAAAFARESKAEGRPFFAQLSFHALHRPENASAASRAAVAERMGKANDKSVGRAALTQDLDAGIARLIAALEQEGLLDSTFVVYMSDNGAKDEARVLAGGKGDLYEAGIRVPMIVRGPGVPAGEVLRAPVCGFDLYPTFLEWAGFEGELPPELEGDSLAALLAGEAGEVARARPFLAFHFPHYQGKGGPQSALVQGDWKLLHLYEGDRVELYDLASDPGERRDLAAEEPELAARLDALLVEHLAASGARLPAVNTRHEPGATPEPRGGGRRERGSRGERRRRGEREDEDADERR